MMLTIRNMAFTLIAVGGMLFAGCAPDPDNANTLPFRLEIEQSYTGKRGIVADLDGDGSDEHIFYETSAPQGGGALDLKRFSGTIIDQINFDVPLKRPHLIDLDGDDKLEILAPYVRNDSLFIDIVEHTGKRGPTLFLIDGKPRIDDSQEYEWDPDVKAFFLSDVEGDGTEELITVVNTEYAGLPRGVLVHSLETGQRLDEYIIGARPNVVHLGDFDGDGRDELVFGSTAVNNEAEAGGFDDLHAYVFLFDLDLPLQKPWASQLSGLYSQIYTYREDFDDDGLDDILIRVARGGGKPQPPNLALLNPVTRRLLPMPHSLTEPVKSMLFADLNRDARSEILLLYASGRLEVLNRQFERTGQYQLPRETHGLQILDDVNSDGYPELMVTMPDEIQLLDHNFRPLTVLPRLDGPRVVRNSFGAPPMLAGLDKEGNFNIYRLVKNNLWWAYRYGPWAGGLAVLCLMLWIGFDVRRIHRRNRLLEGLCTAQEISTDTGQLLLSPNGQIKRINPTARAWLGEPTPPALTAFLDELHRSPPHHIEGKLSVGLDQQVKEVHASADPLLVPGLKRSYWLVRLNDLSGGHDPKRSRAWGLMAQRVAHDIKNPLTSILLTLQRLQLEYQDRSSDEAVVYDGYVQRITGQIEHLRRMTRNFMKFVDLEVPHLQETDLNAFVCAQSADTLRVRLPADISLELKLDENLPPVLLDTEQMASALQNLITNAFNAMPEGGIITLATHTTRAVQLPGVDTLRDYVVLEVMDTGVGMTAAVQQWVYEPGYTTHGSTGLGLALVKKIVEDHGGYIELESEPGAGSVFSLYFPVETSSATRGRAGLQQREAVDDFDKAPGNAQA